MIDVVCQEGLHVYKASGASIHIREYTDGIVITIMSQNSISEQSITLPPTIARTLGYRMVRYANRMLKDPITGSDPQSDPKP